MCHAIPYIPWYTRDGWTVGTNIPPLWEIACRTISSHGTGWTETNILEV